MKINVTLIVFVAYEVVGDNLYELILLTCDRKRGHTDQMWYKKKIGAHENYV